MTMRLQVLSDLHLETEDFEPAPAPGADLLVLAGDIDADWDSYARFRGWPVPVLVVAGNHEFDGRDLEEAWPALRDRLDRFGLRLLECESVVIAGRDGRRIRFLGTIRWSDFDVFGAAGRPRAMRAAQYFQRLMASRRGERPFDADAVRDEALRCRQWLASALATSDEPPADRCVVITHFAPSLRSADPRFGPQPSTASFCNADDDLMPLADLWIHGHVHCRHDYRVPRAGGETRVVSQARGHRRKGEADGHEPGLLIEI